MVLEKVDAVVYLAAFYLFYVQYFFLFTVFAGSTPGMQLRELTIVRLDGTLPDTRQLLWRAFGYAMSGATFMLGFVWSGMGRGQIHLARSHFANLHHGGDADRRAGSI